MDSDPSSPVLRSRPRFIPNRSNLNLSADFVSGHSFNFIPPSQEELDTATSDMPEAPSIPSDPSEPPPPSIPVESVAQVPEEAPRPAEEEENPIIIAPQSTPAETLITDAPAQTAPEPQATTGDPAVQESTESVAGSEWHEGAGLLRWTGDYDGFVPPLGRTPRPEITNTPADLPPATETEITPPPPPPPIEEPKPEIPEWVTHEEDTSVPDEVELKEIETGSEDFGALDFKHLEKYFFHQVDDPEQRPLKRFRLNWTIGGVRGTKEKPNFARVLNSPAAYIDGLYWHIKFFPRGNNSSALSAYLKCSRTAPKWDSNVPESTFNVFQGSPDEDLTQIKPDTTLKVITTQAKSEEESKKPIAEIQSEEEAKKTEPEQAAPELQESAKVDQSEISQPIVKVDEDDWRVSAQLGLILYNPKEPRTHHYSTSEHQFNKHNDDWGWTNFSGPWKDIHRRKRGQRAPLLQNDTLSMDAYIQVFEDPTQALWWHPSPDSESQWDSKSLTGYFPMGTPPLYHSPGVAGLTAFLLLAPFRKLIQDIDSSLWRKDSCVKPQPLICQLKQVLFLMRSMRKDETYVNVNYALENMDNAGETYWDVKAFWEALRRSIELELEGNHEALTRISDIFDGKGKTAVTLTPSGYLKVPVLGGGDVQTGLKTVLGSRDEKTSFPNFLPVLLDRQMFDKVTREWKLLYDRVRLNETIDLSSYSCDEAPSEYTLYGFMVHVGERTSGKFYSVLRPNGPGSKWLAFEDGDGNKVFSYTKRRVEKFEGFEGDELKSVKAPQQVAYLAMYIRTSCLKEYLPGQLEPYDMADWLKAHLSSRWYGDEKPLPPPEVDTTETEIEVFLGASAKGRNGLLDMFNLKSIDREGEHFHKLTVPGETTFAEIRWQLAERLKIDKVEKLRLWMMQFSPLGEYMTASLARVTLADTVGPEIKEVRPLCLWVDILESDEDVKLYGYIDPTPEEIKARKEELEEEEVIIEDVVLQNPPPTSDATTAVIPRRISLSLSPQDPADRTPTATSPLPPPASTEDIEAEIIAQIQANSLADNMAANSPAASETPIPSASSAQEVSHTQDGIAEAEIDNAIAAPDVVQASVEEAVRHDVEAAGARSEIPVEAPPSPEVEIQSAQTTQAPEPVITFEQPETTREATSTAPTSSAALVEHEDHVDVVHVATSQTAESDATGTPGTATPTESSDTSDHVQAENEALIASIIAADVAAAEGIQVETAVPPLGDVPPNPPGRGNTLIHPPAEQSPAGQNDTPHTLSTPSSEPVPDEQPTLRRPVAHTYGFIQIFDAEKQDFFVHGSFFAGWNADVRSTVRKHLGYDADQDFLLWQRIKAYHTAPISASTSFSDINFRDGVDLIVGAVLDEEKKDALLAKGFFVTPRSLSQVIHMRARRHPVQAYSGEIVLREFGAGFYEGPMLNGRYHGENGMWITANGHSYTGSFIADEKSGPGEMIYANGDTYSGTWLKDEKHGQGTLIEARTGNKYVGGFEGGKRWGEGVTYWKVADEQSDLCQICYVEGVDALFYECGHVVACVECARQCDCCPICRRPVVKVVRMFRS